MQKTILLLLILFQSTIFNGQILKNDFESGMGLWTGSPTNWAIDNAQNASSNNWTIALGSHFAYFNDDLCNCAGSIEILTSPLIENAHHDYRLSYSCFFNSGSYQGTTEEAMVVLLDSLLNINDTLATIGGANHWQNQSLHFNTILEKFYIGYAYIDNGAWLYGLAIDEVELDSLRSYEVKISSSNNPTHIIEGESIPIHINISNIGTDSVHQIQLAYQLNNGDTIQMSTATNMPSFGNISITLTDLLQGDSATTNTVQVWPMEINNTPINEVDTLLISFVNLSHKLSKNVLVEHFTGNTQSCIPCQNNKEGLIQLAQETGFNGSQNNSAMIMYMTDTDSLNPAITTAGINRKNEYAISIPSTVLNGAVQKTNAGFDITASDIDFLSSENALLNIALDHYFSNDSLFAQIQIESYADLNDSLKVFLAICEKNITQDILGNGQDHYIHLFRKFADLDASVLAGISRNESINISGVCHLEAAMNVAPLSGQFFTSIDNISVIAFVQRSQTGEVLQSKGLIWPTAIENSVSNSLLKLYPNPAGQFFNLEYQGEEKIQSMVLYNTMGQVINQWNGVSNRQTYSISNTLPGMYLLQVVLENGVSQKHTLIIQ